VADDSCWFVLREEYCWLVAGSWFVVREKYCWLVTGGWLPVAGLLCEIAQCADANGLMEARIWQPKDGRSMEK
jgi:hypothetical protein